MITVLIHVSVIVITSAHCSIEVLAYGANSNGTVRYGHVKLNTVPVWQASWFGQLPNPCGVTTILVDPFTCSAREPRRFDTNYEPDAATELSHHLQEVNRGKIIVGVSADEPMHRLANALDTLRGIGADVADVQHRGSFGFVAQKGFPTKTILRKVLTEAEGLAKQPHFTVTVTGTFCFRKCHVVGTLFFYHYSNFARKKTASYSSFSLPLIS